MFDRLSSKKPKTEESRKKKSKTEANEDFLAELNKLKAKKLKEKLASNSNGNSSTKTTDSPSKSENQNPKSESTPARDPPKETPTTEKSRDASKEEIPLSKLTPRERLARLRAEKEAEDKKKLDAMANGKNSFDREDMKLLFSQKW